MSILYITNESVTPPVPTSGRGKLYSRSAGLFFENDAAVEFGITPTEIEIDFGSAPSFGQAFTITDANISANSLIMAAQSGEAATGRNQDENEMDNIGFSAAPGVGQFTLYATPMWGPVTGKYKVNYTH
jgi:hypothetical protein